MCKPESQDRSAVTLAEIDARVAAAIPANFVVVPQIRFDFEGFFALAISLGMQDPVARQEWVLKELDRFVEYVSAISPGDRLISQLPPGTSS